MLLFSLKDISIAPKGVSILNQLSLEVYEGENWAIVGNSGAGKSVLLQYLAGRFHSTRGEEQYPYFDRFITQCGKEEAAIVHRGQLAVYVSSEHDFYTLSNTRDFYYQQRYTMPVTPMMHLPWRNICTPNNNRLCVLPLNGTMPIRWSACSWRCCWTSR